VVGLRVSIGAPTIWQITAAHSTFAAIMLKLEGVAKQYGRFQALQPLDLEVRAGEVFGFLGPNGAGKTTTIRMIAGVLSPTAGRITIGGLDIALHPVESKRKVGYVPDRPYLYDKLTAREFLAFVGRLYGISRDDVAARTERLLGDHGLLDRADELVEAFSHGMKQRLVLSAALLHEPPLLVVDEPMVGLDPAGARMVKDLFRRLATEGRTLFLSTHSLDVAQEVCHRVGILYKGRLVALGTMDELTASADLEEVFLRITEEQSEPGAVRAG
jgi:ABC-2 type transport system ATP-binding protein